MDDELQKIEDLIYKQKEEPDLNKKQALYVKVNKKIERFKEQLKSVEEKIEHVKKYKKYTVENLYDDVENLDTSEMKLTDLVNLYCRMKYVYDNFEKDTKKQKFKLDPEIEEGNIEYKRCLFNVRKDKFQKLSSQMRWRIKEGEGICMYYLGVKDDGNIYKLSSLEKADTLETIIKLSIKNDLQIIDYQAENGFIKITLKDNKFKEDKIYDKHISKLIDDESETYVSEFSD